MLGRFSKRQFVWTAVGVAAALAIVYVNQSERSEPDRSPMRSRVGVQDGRALQGPDAFSELVKSLGGARLSAEIQGEPFSGRTWVAAPPAPKAAPAPAAPPAFPFKYAGRLQEAAEATRVYLTKAGELVLVRQGDVLDGAWRVESITSERIELSHLPSAQRLSMLLPSLAGEASVDTGVRGSRTATPFARDADGPGAAAAQQQSSAGGSGVNAASPSD